MSMFRNRWARRAGVAVVLLGAVWVGVVAVLWVNTRREGEARRAKAIADLDAADPGWRTTGVEAAHNAAVAPPEQNAGEQALAALALLSDEYKQFDKTRDYAKDQFPHLPPADELAALRAALKSTAAAVEQARGVRKLPGGGFRLTFKEPDLIGTLLPNTQEMRRVAGLLSDAALVAAADDRGDDALDAILCLLHLDRALGDEPFSISALVRMAILAIGYRATERTLAWTPTATDPKLAEVQAELLRLAGVPRLKAAVRGERAICYRILENIEAGAFDPTGWIANGSPVDAVRLKFQQRHWPAQQADVLDHFNRVVAACDLPPHERRQVFAEVEAAVDALAKDRSKAPMSVLVGLLFPALAKVVEADTRTVGLLRATAVAVACERHRLKHGRFPDTLAALTPSFLSEFPADPYTGKPLLYRRTDDGAVVYVCGADRTDDGGKLKPGSEAGFDVGIRLFDETHRRRPPVPKPAPEPDGNQP